jgi:hypothetical protein
MGFSERTKTFQIFDRPARHLKQSGNTCCDRQRIHLLLADVFVKPSIVILEAENSDLCKSPLLAHRTPAGLSPGKCGVALFTTVLIPFDPSFHTPTWIICGLTILARMNFLLRSHRPFFERLSPSDLLASSQVFRCCFSWFSPQWPQSLNQRYVRSIPSEED